MLGTAGGGGSVSCFVSFKIERWLIWRRRHVERDPSLLLKQSQKVHAVGLCTGLLSAATLAAAEDLQDLVNLATYMIGVAFRLRLELHYRSRYAENINGTWGYLVIGVHAEAAEKELERFHTAEVRDTEIFAYRC